MFEIEAVRHVISLSVPLIQGWESKYRLAETDEADVRVEALRDVAGSRERAEHETANP